MVNDTVNNLKIRQFWEWFFENCQKFGASFENEELLESLDNWISQLGDFSWEVGPGKAKDNALVISPHGDHDLLQNTKQIIAGAKDCEGWEFYYAKPPKEEEWELIFTFETTEGEMVDVDASPWEYTLLKYDDGMLEIIIKAPDLRELDESDKQIAAEIVLDGVLGEEVRMRTICRIEVVDEFDRPYRDKAGNIKYLSEHVKSLLKQ